MEEAFCEDSQLKGKCGTNEAESDRAVGVLAKEGHQKPEAEENLFEGSCVRGKLKVRW